MKLPVMLAVLVPPSPWRTSQSIHIVLSPNAFKSATARNDLPTSRWISCVRPPTFPLDDSLGMRRRQERGSIPYSAVIQPVPEFFKNVGTASSIEAEHITRVCPSSIRHDPSANSR